MKYYLKPSFILLLIFYISANSLKAQHTVKGKVLDDKGNPIDYASVVLQVDGETDVKYDITNEKGKFTIDDVKKGNYKLYVQYFSKDIYTETIKVAGDLELGNITAKSGFALLDEVVKTSKKPMIEQKVDRLVFNASSSIAASDGSALDALKKTPMVNVKQDEISLIGKGSVAVLINDRIVRLSGEDLVSFLESVSSVKSIEVITNPPAKYEAEGSGGLINIVLKKGLLNHWNNSTRTSYKQATYPSFSAGNTFNYNKDKLSISADIGGRKDSIIYFSKNIIFFPNAKNEIRSPQKGSINAHSGRLGIDYKLGKNANIGGIFRIAESFMWAKDKTESIIRNDNNIITSRMFSKGKLNNKKKNIAGNLHYYQKLDTMGRSFNIDLSYFKHKVYNDMVLKSSDKSQKNIIKEKSNIKNTGDQQIINYSVKLDIEHPTSWANINYGGKLSYSNTENNSKFYNIVSENTILDHKKTDHFNYQENIYALYFDIAKNIRKWQLKLGLRYEHTSTLGNSAKEGKNKRRYGKLFPTAYLQYSLNDENTFNLIYSRRIRRPSFGDLNPFKFYIDYNSYEQGNPYLQPSFTNTIQLTHGWKSKLFTSINLQLNNNSFTRIMILDNNERKKTMENVYKSCRLGLFAYYTFNPFTWWESSNKFKISYYKPVVYKKYENIIQVHKGSWNPYIATSNYFTLNPKKTFLGELEFYYYFPSQAGIWQNEASYSLNIALKAYFLKRRLTVSLSANDILQTSNSNSVGYINNNIKRVSSSYDDSRYVKLTLRYSFGNKKIEVKDRQFGNKEESERAN